MSIFMGILFFALCAVLYARMIRREVPEPLTKKQASFPVVLGVFAPIFSTTIVVLIGFAFKAILHGETLSEKIGSPLWGALAGSFFAAGFTEEIVKFLLFLLVIRRMKPKNVYEYGLYCAGIGFGFTALEEVLYGGSPMRLPGFAMHMVFGLVMGLELGKSRYCRQQGIAGAGMHAFLALFLPVLWHTLYDAATAFNPGLDTTNETVETAGILAGVAVVLVSTVLQFVLLWWFRKKSTQYCEMELQQ